MKTKRILLSLLVLLCTYVSFAQQDSVARKMDLRFITEHLLCQRGEETNVIDVDLEWPEVVDYTSVDTLKAYLCRTLFDVNSTNFDNAYGSFKQRFGNEVTKNFDVIPDDNKFCYVDFKLKVLGHLEGHLISFKLSKYVSPMRASTVKGDTINRYVTYDMINHKILLMNDIINTRRLNSGNFSSSFLIDVSANSKPFVGAQVGMLNFLDVAMAEDRILVDGIAYVDNGEYDFTTSVSYKSMGGLLYSDVKRIIDAKRPRTMPHLVKCDDTYRGEKVYTVVDVLPSFKGGNDALMTYLSDNLNYPTGVPGLGNKSKVMVGFIVMASGEIVDVRILNSVSPEVDREAVRLVKLMPRWNAGQKDGKAVNVRVTFPLTLCLTQ